MLKNIQATEKAVLPDQERQALVALTASARPRQ